MNFNKRAWEIRYEETKNLITADLYYGSAHYATIWRAKLPGATERVTAEAQSIVDEAQAAKSIGWPVRPARPPRIDPRLARCRGDAAIEGQAQEAC